MACGQLVALRRLSEFNLLIFAFVLYALIALAILLALPHAFYLRGALSGELRPYDLGTMYFTAIFLGSAGFGWTWLTVRLGLLERRPCVLTLLCLALPVLTLFSESALIAFGGKLYLLTLPLAAQALLRSLYWKGRFSITLARLAIVLWIGFLALWLWYITERSSWLNSKCSDISRSPGFLAAWSCTLPLADSVVMHRLLLWRRTGVLLVRNTSFQFSLAELLVATVAIATLVGIVVKLF